jgi:hypothetical protein
LEKFSNREWLLLIPFLVAIPFPKGVGISFDEFGACYHGASQAAGEDDGLLFGLNPYRLPCGYVCECVSE